MESWKTKTIQTNKQVYKCSVKLSVPSSLPLLSTPVITVNFYIWKQKEANQWFWAYFSSSRVVSRGRKLKKKKEYGLWVLQFFCLSHTWENKEIRNITLRVHRAITIDTRSCWRSVFNIWFICDSKKPFNKKYKTNKKSKCKVVLRLVQKHRGQCTLLWITLPPLESIFI